MKKSTAALFLLALTSAGIHAQTDAAKAPSAYARVVPERKGDVVWENDLAAYRIYGPPLKNSPEHENSGIDVWFKRVPYPVVDKWYREDIAHTHSYHKEGPEGYDGFKVADTRGAGGTALWREGKLVLSGVYETAKVLSSGPKEIKILVTYRYETPEGAVNEEKTITMKVGEYLFHSRSIFTRDGKPLAGLPVAIGLVTQSPKAEITMEPKRGILAIWDVVDGAGFGIGAVVPPAMVVEMLRQPTSDQREHALCIVKTGADGAVAFQAGSAWSKGGVIRTAADWLAVLGK